MRRGAFRVSAAQQEPGERGTIDSFLVSLAEEFREEAIGIVFAETSGDGTLGVAALKENGCLAIAETPRGGMPNGGLAAHAATPSCRPASTLRRAPVSSESDNACHPLGCNIAELNRYHSAHCDTLRQHACRR